MISHNRAAEPVAGPANAPAIGPRLLFAKHHRELEAAYRTLLASIYANAPYTLIKRYRMFEHAMLEHLTAEETLVLPVFAVHAPLDAQAVRVHHAALRKLLIQVGVEMELQLVRLETAASLIEALREHAEHDASMYAWAELYLPVTARRRLAARIGRSLDALAQLQTRWLAASARSAEM